MKKRIILLMSIIFIIFCFISCKDKTNTQNQKTEETNAVREENSWEYNSFFIDNVRFNNSGDLVITAYESFDKNQDFNSLITLEGLDDNKINITPFSNKLVIKANFKKEVPYTIKISKNIKSESGSTIQQDFYKYNLYMNKKAPNLFFSDSGSVLPSINNKKINFNSINVKKVKLEVIKVYSNNVTQYLQRKDYLNEWTLKEDIGDTVFTKEYNIDTKEDETIKNSIDLSGILDTKGIYYIKLSAESDESIDYDIEKYGSPMVYDYGDKPVYAKATKTIILSDVGILANTNNKKLEIKLLNLNTLNPITNAKIEFISKKNQTLEEGRSNNNGEYKSKLTPDDIMYILIKSGDEFNVLYLKDNKINYSDFDIGGSLESGDLKLYTYTDKGFYRPGDSINISLIARSTEALRNNQPFEYSFISPDNSEKISKEVVSESKNGFYTFTIPTDINDLTGAWTLKIKFGSKEIDQKIFIESKVANLISIDMDEDKVYTKEDIDTDGKIDFKVKAQYLTGLKAANTEVNYDYTLIEKPIFTKKYKDYIFEDESKIKYQYRDYINDRLNENGEAVFKLEIPKNAKELNFNLAMLVNVLDTNGRYSTESKTFNIINRENTVGIRKISQANNTVNIKYILLNEKSDTLVEGKKLKYRVYNKEYNWWFDSYDDGNKSFKEDVETTLLEEGNLISDTQPQILKISNLGNGTNFIEIEDTETGNISGIFVYNYHYGDKKHGSVENLSINSDKEKYNVNDNAQIKYTGAIGGKALITVEKDGKVLKKYWKTLTSTENIENIKIEKEYFPNVYVTINVFQKYLDKENDRPLRLYGAVPLIVEDKNKLLNIEVKTESEVKPSSDLKIKLSNKENKKMYYEVFLVDEGILRMTGYKKPDPYKFFYQKQAKLIENFDNFSNVIEKYSDKVMNRLKTGGGDYEENQLMGLASAKVATFRTNNINQNEAIRFKNIVIFNGVAESNDNGEAFITVKVPNYFGSMKLFVVAVSDDSYGSYEQNIQVKAPVIVETSAPRVLKVGDKFQVPITLFPIEKNLGAGEIIINYDGKTYNKKVNLKDDEIEKLDFVLSAPNKVGRIKLYIEYKSDKYNFKDTIDFNVDTNYPYQYIENLVVLKPNAEYILPISEFKNFVENSLENELSITSYQKLELDKMITSLLDYPYICLEQTTSKGKALLYIDKLTTNLQKRNEARNHINTIIRKLATNYQLRNGAFVYWPGSKNENISLSVYTTEFLIQAKDRGYYIPENTLKLAIEYLNSLVMRTDISTEDKVNILNVLSQTGQANISEMNIIFDRYYKNLSLTSKWKLLTAYNKIGEENFAREEASKLSKKAKDEDFYSEIFNNAEILKSYTEIFNITDRELFLSLLTSAKANLWLTTIEKANIVEALAKDPDLTIEKNVIPFEIVIDGKSVNYETINGEYLVKNIGLNKNDKKITVRNKANSNLYINYFYKGKPIKFEEKNENKNILIDRKFVNFNGKEIDVKNLKVGTKFKIILTTHIENKDYLENVALLQILPSGWEFDTTQNNNNDIDFLSNSIDYVDMRDDRVAYFFSSSSFEDTTIEINVNAVTPGEYKLPGTKVEAMYDNNFRAYLKGFDVKVISK